MISIVKLDGSSATLTVPPYAKILYEHVDQADFEKAIRLCWFVKDRTLWGCLAAMSLYCRELETSEIALAAIDEVDKVQFINYIKELPSDASKNAALALYCKKINEAETILLQAKLFYRAIKMNIKLYRWEWALELALKYKTHLDTVIGFRKQYLEQMGKNEDSDKFKQYAREVTVDWEAINWKIEQDKAAG